MSDLVKRGGKGKTDCPFPHCDSKILHAPGECEYCNDYPDMQNARIAWGISFTGKKEKGKSKCPAEKARKLSIINRWHGNVSMDEKQKAADDAYWKSLKDSLSMCPVCELRMDYCVCKV